MLTRKLMSALLLGFASLVVAATAPAQSDTTGKVSIESKAVAVGVGVTWGDGTLTYRGKQHKFTIDGLSVLDLGVSKVSATGEVSDLKSSRTSRAPTQQPGPERRRAAGPGSRLWRTRTA